MGVAIRLAVQASIARQSAMVEAMEGLNYSIPWTWPGPAGGKCTLGDVHSGA